MNIFVRIVGATRTINWLLNAREKAAEAAEKASLTVGDAALAEIKRLAPVDTGKYRDSINMGRQGKAVIIGTSEPYGARLEFGFGGPDSMGRVFPVNPQPHFGPVADQLGARLETEIMRELGF